MNYNKPILLRHSITFFSLSFFILFIYNLNSEISILSNEVISFVSFVMLLILILLKVKELPSFLTVVIVASFLFKAFYSYNVYRTIVSPFPDTFGYLDNLEKMKMSSIDIDSVKNISGTLQFGYNYFIYFIDSIFQTKYALYLVNILLHSISSIMFYKLIKNDFSDKIANVSTTMFLFSTNMLLFTSNILKDSLVISLVIASFYIYKVSKVKKFVIVPILLLFLVRIYAGGSVMLAIAFDMVILGNYTLKKKIIGFGTIGLATVVLANRFFLFSEYVRIIKSFLINTNIVNSLTSTLASLSKFYFSPLPWNLISRPDKYLITMTDSVLALMFSFSLIMFILKFIKSKVLRNKMWIYLIPIFVHAFALGVQYNGDSARQRIGIYGFIILTFVVGLFYKVEKNEKKDIKLNRTVR